MIKTPVISARNIFYTTMLSLGLSGLYSLPLSAQQTAALSAENIPLDVDAIYKEITPSEEYTTITRSVLSQMVRNHYSEVRVNDDFSSTLLDRVIDGLDPSRIYFTQADINEFEQYRTELDDMLRAGDVDAGFLMYNRYQKRVIERLVFSLKRLEKDGSPFDFTLDEYLIVDRSEEPWPASHDELEDLWRKRVKSNVLSALLSDETYEEAKEDLSERYRYS